jgi:hypothetical protein
MRGFAQGWRFLAESFSLLGVSWLHCSSKKGGLGLFNAVRQILIHFSLMGLPGLIDP